MRGRTCVPNQLSRSEPLRIRTARGTAAVLVRFEPLGDQPAIAQEFTLIFHDRNGLHAEFVHGATDPWNVKKDTGTLS
jgi:hypothetical protein